MRRNLAQSAKGAAVKMAFACGTISLPSTNCQRTDPFHILPAKKHGH